MSGEEKLEKKNSDILSLYITARNNIKPNKITPETVNMERERIKAYQII